MTLVLSVHGRDTLWVVVDRRLSYGQGRRPNDDAIKLTLLHASDGVAILAYAGLGATRSGVEPSAWMSATLRARPQLSVEEALGVVASAGARELPRHMRPSIGVHNIVAPAFVRGHGRRLYTVDNVLNWRTGEHRHRYVSHRMRGGFSPPLCLAGTGGEFLRRRQDSWRRLLLRLVNAHDRGRVSDEAVPNHLAKLAQVAHKGVTDGTVGPRSIVVWRRRPDASPLGPAGAHHCFADGDPEAEGTPLQIPTVAGGFDIAAISRTSWDLQEERRLEDPSSPLLGLDYDTVEFERRLAELPDTPEDRLR